MHNGASQFAPVYIELDTEKSPAEPPGRLGVGELCGARMRGKGAGGSDGGITEQTKSRPGPGAGLHDTATGSSGGQPAASGRRASVEKIRVPAYSGSGPGTASRSDLGAGPVALLAHHAHSLIAAGLQPRV